MTNFEQEQIVNEIELKAGVLQIRLNEGTVKDEQQAQELLELVQDARRNGTSLTEAGYLLDDLSLALS